VRSGADDPGELITLTEAAARLGVHYMTAYRYLRTGRLDGVRQGPEWRVRATEVERLGARPAARSATPPVTGPTPATPRRRINWAHRVETRLLNGDEAGAWTVLEAAMTGGMSPETIYVSVLAPALRAIGDRWEAGEITVADEHQASAVALRLIGRLGPRFARRGRKRGTIVVAAPAGDAHGLPVALFADLLRGRGFRVIDLGADVPSDALAASVAGLPGLLAVGLGATTQDNDPAIREAIAAVRAVSDVPVLLGGGAIGRPEDAKAHGADAGGRPTLAAIELFEHLGTSSAPPRPDAAPKRVVGSAI
jgi:excisionase family DNA binding protein